MGDDIQDAIRTLQALGHEKLAKAVLQLRAEQNLMCEQLGKAQQAAQDFAIEATRKAFCSLQRYSFFLDAAGGVRRVPERHGNWVEFEAAHTLFDPVVVDASVAKLHASEAITKAKDSQ